MPIPLFGNKKKPSGPTGKPHRPSWRDYQDSLKRESGVRINHRRWLGRLAVISILMLISLSVFKAISSHPPGTNAPEAAPGPAKASKKNLIDKKSLQVLLEDQLSGELMADTFQIDVGGQPLNVTTTLDPELQASIIDKFDRKNSRYISVVTLSPSDGRILSMAGFNKDHPRKNPCLNNEFPAASIFKIVTAAAAIEKLDYNANSVLKFNGYKHTLYKKQLKELNNRYTNKIKLSDSFAQSVNPVFGKLGILYLKKPALVEYSTAFGFNKQVDFEIPMPPSQFSIKDEPYHWAEIASGFNRQTTLTPVHGAMMAAAVVNGGKMVEPSIIENIMDADSKVLYETHPDIFTTPMSDNTAKIIRQLMEKTVKSGTARKAFRGYQRNTTLSKLDIGGKTGSIFNKAHDLRFDWFVGYATEKGGNEKIAVCAVVAHEEYIGRRATDYAKLVFLHHFKNYFTRNESDARTAGKGS